VRRKSGGEYYLVDPKRDLPVTHLPWNLATEFAAWMGMRLPTEAEWVKAARGTDKRMWPWGDEYPDDTLAGYNANYDCNLLPVDAFPLGKSPYGAYNMSGNVFELVQDWFNTDWDAAIKDNVRNPKPPATATLTHPNPGPMKILRGGRWASPANGITVYRRNLYSPDKPFICHGTRFAIDETVVRTQLSKGTAKVAVQ
jgi:iron(II)-dependent oxidoreductase